MRKTLLTLLTLLTSFSKKEVNNIYEESGCKEKDQDSPEETMMATTGLSLPPKPSH